jgi:predicted ABC-type ATPase
MRDITPRMRMFAGPNGSGKSTIIDIVQRAKGSAFFGVYINADEIEKQVNEYGFLDFRAFHISIEHEEWLKFAVPYTLSFKPALLDSINRLTLIDDKLLFNEIIMNSYYASVIASFIRYKLLEEKVDFTFETVMSHEEKVEFMNKAQSSGFKTYLYFVATDDPEINISRVKNRVLLGGHDVLEEKIRERYIKSINLLKEVLKFSDRAYIFDNSGLEHSFIASYSRDERWVLEVNEVPNWFANAVPSLQEVQND